MQGQFEAIRRFVFAHRRSLVIATVLFVAAAVAFRVARRDLGYWAIDDAGITYAAAFELVDHHSLATSPEGPPIEGYSNPIVFFVTALLRVFGAFDPVTTHLHLEMLLFALMVTLVWSMARAFTGEVAAVIGAIVFAAVELVTPATWIWYGSGLENVWVSCGLVALAWICARTSRGVPLSPAWGNAAFAVAITRPEAPVYVAAFYIALAVFAKPDDLTMRAHLRQVSRALLVTIALYIVFLAWRRFAYGTWLPNTYYAKLYGQVPGNHLRDYVVAGILPYTRAALFASSVLVLLALRRFERLAMVLACLLVASLALPIRAGADWMGEHRFATPFLAMCHLTYAVLIAACIGRAIQARPRRIAHVALVVAVLSVVGLMKYDRLAIRDPIELNPITIPLVAQGEGGRRWEQHMRLGVPYAVVQIPDAGGSQLVGGMQMVDNGYLTDFHMARMGRQYDRPRDLRVLNAYQHAERRPDVVSEDKQFALDRSYLFTRYLPPGGGPMWPRRDLLEVASIDPDAKLLYEESGLRIYLSPETVRTAAPRGLVRCELVVAWTELEMGAMHVRGSVAHGDRDDVQLFPYQRIPSGIERFGLLLGAPDRTGTFPVTLELTRDGRTIPLGTFDLEVTKDFAHAAEAATRAPTPQQAAHRLAWLREQARPRMGMTAFHATCERLLAHDREHEPEAGELIFALRENARIAALGDVPAPIHTAELTVLRRAFERCPPTDAPTRMLCLGRTVDDLRRLGYLGILARMPEVARELDADRLDGMTRPDRYRALVGILLADPTSIRLHWQLVKLRRVLAAANTLPDL